MSELKVLLVEDSERDAALILRELRRSGYSVVSHRVETAADMTAALENGTWDIILCDHALPQFDGMDALELLRRRDREVPFIIVSGQIGEDLAVEAMKAGANDYIMKSNLKRLAPAIQREIRDAQERLERRQIEEELRITEEELRVARQVEKMKDEFIGMVSHELKSPLTVIIGALSVATADEVPPDEAGELVRDALLSAEALNVIIDNLLELSRSQRSRLSLRLQPCDIAGVVTTVLRKLERKSDRHSLVRDIPPDLPLVPADAIRVERILYNLVDNAIKYSPEGGTVKIAVQPKDTSLIVSVSDDGIGISAADQRKLFHHFQRLQHEESREIEGVGLGLKVCQVLTEAHGGRIWLSSTPGVGSTFFFSLPLGSAGAGQAS